MGAGQEQRRPLITSPRTGPWCARATPGRGITFGVTTPLLVFTARVEDDIALGAVLLETGHNPLGDGAGVDGNTDQCIGGASQMVERLGVPPLPAVAGPPLLVSLEQRLPDGSVQQPAQAGPGFVRTRW